MARRVARSGASPWRTWPILPQHRHRAVRPLGRPEQRGPGGLGAAQSWRVAVEIGGLPALLLSHRVAKAPMLVAAEVLVRVRSGGPMPRSSVVRGNTASIAQASRVTASGRRRARDRACAPAVACCVDARAGGPNGHAPGDRARRRRGWGSLPARGRLAAGARLWLPTADRGPGWALSRLAKTLGSAPSSYARCPMAIGSAE
jgi:hypothetical protein